MLIPAPLGAQSRLTQDDALRLAFPPPAVIERRTAFLTEEQLARAKALAGADVQVTSRVVTYYLGLRDGAPLAVAYFDRHRVRTLNQVLMFVVAPDGRFERVDILDFQEPPDYRASPGWLGQLVGRRLDDGLSLKGSVVNLTGATLTSRAITRASRRVLALHQVIAPLAPAARP
ncbi:MAG: FMN-binding protein [Gemmatimonadetes bacterium]|nr:FMN-binding protein [Gemmatimonadota bacterium]MBI2401447.1 FMN-binding protein [Gemmatimonadota bacterium]